MTKTMCIMDDDGTTHSYLVCDKEDAAAIAGISASMVLKLHRKKVLRGFSDGKKGGKSKLFFKVSDLEYYKLHRNDPEPEPVLRPVGVESSNA